MLMGQGAFIVITALALSTVPVSFSIRKAGFEREDKVIGWSEKYRGTSKTNKAAGAFVEHISWQPRAYHYHGFLTPEECDHLIELAKPKMVKATVLDEKTKKQIPNKLRNNKESWLGIAQDEVVGRVEKRISRYTFLPLDNGEPLHIMQYLVGQSYAPHTDFLDDWWHPQLGNERIATVIMYLSDVAEGGETVFPNSTSRLPEGNAPYSKCAREGLAVRPRKGDALMFYNLLETGRTDGCSMHQGCPVIRGEKWTATKRILVNRRPHDAKSVMSFIQRATAHDMLARPSTTLNHIGFVTSAQ